MEHPKQTVDRPDLENADLAILDNVSHAIPRLHRQCFPYRLGERGLALRGDPGLLDLDGDALGLIVNLVWEDDRVQVEAALSISGGGD